MHTYARTSILLLVGFLVGAVVGAIALLELSSPASAMNAYLVSRDMETQAYLRYRFGNREVARTSMRLCVEVLEHNASDLRQAQPYEFPRRLGIAYARLAMVAEEAPERERFLLLARQQLASAGSQLSAEDIEEALRVIDADWDRAVRSTAVNEQPDLVKK